MNVALLTQLPQAEDRPPVAGFVGWWDAANQASIQGLSGNKVSSWRDPSSGLVLATASAGREPFTGGVTQNGRNVLWTTGKVTQLNGPNGLPAASRPWTGFAVMTETSGDAAQRTPWVAKDAVGGFDNRPYRSSTDVIGLWGGNAGLVAAQTFERGRPRVLSFAFYGTAGDLGVDGRYRYSGSGGTIAPDTRHNVFSHVGAEPWYGWIGELIVYATQLPLDQVQRVESYLMQKWGLA